MVTGVEVFRDEGWIGMVRVVSSRITYGQRSCRYRYPNTHPEEQHRRPVLALSQTRHRNAGLGKRCTRVAFQG